MDPEQTNELSASVRKDVERIEQESTGLIADSILCTGDVGHTQCIPTIKDDARMTNPPPFTSPSASFLRQQSRRRNGASSLVPADDDFSSSDNVPELEITTPKYPPAKNHVHLSRSLPKISQYVSISISPPPSPSMPAPRARVEVHPFSSPAKRTVSKSLSTVRPQSRSSQSSISNNDKPPILRKRKVQHHSSLETCAVSNLKPPHRLPSSSASSIEASASRVDRDNLCTLEYDLDKDPTQETYEFRDQFHERSPFSAVLSARFIHAHLFERLSDSTTPNDELMSNEGDLVTEFIEPAALVSVGPHDAISPSYPLGSATVPGNPDPTPIPDYCDLGLEGATHTTDPFTVLTMDDIINYQPWGPDAETMIDPSVLGDTPAFSESRFLSPAPTPFRDFHSWKRACTPSPPLTRPALTVRVPPRASASTSGSNPAQTPGDVEGNLGGGKAKFYKKGALQTPPHLINSQRQRSVSAKTSESIRISRRLSPGQMTSTDSPITEFSVSDLLANGVTPTSSIATPSEAANTVDEDVTVISSGSGTPPARANGTKMITARKEKRSAGQKGPYRIIAVNETAHCHQCRRSTPHPKMHCCACPKLYCILCIVKRYHNIEFHQFKKDFDCPACLNICNCTACCDKRQEVYVTSRHIKFDKETMDKLLSGEIRSLPHISASLAGPREKLKPGQDPISSRSKESLLVTRKGKTPARRKRASNLRVTYDDDDYNESDASAAPNTSVRVKPAQAVLQTQRMLKESGSGRYWGAVYSLSGERIGMSYVGSNLQNITVQTNGFSSVTDYPPSSSQQRRKRVYVGMWQDAWGFRSETPDGSSSEDEKRANKRSRNNRELGHARFYYVGNQNIIRAWRKARSTAVQRPPVTLLQPAGDVDIHTSPSSLPPFEMVCDRYGATDATPTDGIPNDGEDEEDSRSFWIMEDRSSPKKTDLPFFADTSRPGPENVNVPDVCPTSVFETCGQLVTQEDLVKAVASSLQAVGTTVLLPQPTPSPSPLTS